MWLYSFSIPIASQFLDECKNLLAVAVLVDSQCAPPKVSAKDFVGISLERFYVCREMELVASLSCLKYIVGFVGVDHTESPAVLPAKSAELASVVFGSLVAEASDVVASPGVDGDATEIINGVGVAKDNIAVGIGVLLTAVHGVAVAVNKRKPAALVYSAD